MRLKVELYLWVLSFLRPYKWFVLLSIVCILAASIGQLGILKAMQYIIDEIIADKNVPLFHIMLLSMVGLLALMFAAMAANNLLERLIRERAARDLQFACINHLRDLGFSYIEKHPSGETLSLLNTDVSAVQNIYRSHFPTIITNSVMLVVALGFALSIHVQITLIAMACSLTYYVFGPYLNRKVNFWGKIRSDRIRAWNKKLYDSISGLTEFRAFGCEQWDLSRFAQTQKSMNESTIRASVYGNLRYALRDASLTLGIVAVFFIAPGMYEAGKLTIGEYAVFMYYFLNLYNAMSNIVNAVVAQNLILHQAERIKRFMNIEPSVKDSPQAVTLPTIQGEIELQNVVFGYSDSDEDARPVLRGIHLSVRSGEKIALVGTSGNGKTTLLKLIARFYDPTHGVIRLDGVPLRDLKLQQFRDSIGYVFQETYLFGASVRENIRFGRPDATDEEIMEAAIAANAHEFIVELPNGYDTWLGERGMKLSGGQKQRIAIARMLIKNPSIILLDEATSSLDNLSEAMVQTALDRLLQNRTTFAIAHRLSTIKDYDRIVVIDQGVVAEIGSYDELMQRQGIFYKMELQSFENKTFHVGRGRHDP